MSADAILDQADALMRRHRSFVARPSDAAQAGTVAEEDEVPLLTEVVDTSEVAAQDIATLIAALRREMDEALSAWLVEVLPAAVANASQQILAELDAKARHTLLPRLQEILAGHAGEKLNAAAPEPLDERDADDPSV